MERPPTTSPSASVAIQERLTAVEFELDQQVRNASYLADLMGVGIVRLDDALRVELANPAAHILLGRSPGTIVGRSAMEAFVDARIEEVVEDARDTGGGSGEFRRARPGRPDARDPGAALAGQRRVDRPRGRLGAAAPPADPGGVRRQPLARAADAALDDQPARGDARPRRRGRRRRGAGRRCATGSRRSRSRPATSSRWSTSCSTSPGSRAAARWSSSTTSTWGGSSAESAERLRLFAERQGLRLVTDVADGLPTVRGDEARIGQVVVNLVHNAVKFSERRRARSTVRRPRRAARELVVSVEDHGIGIPKADQARIFERFYKVDRARVRGGGTGLGLSIARNVLQQHGGRIWVESEEGVGSTFSFALPVPVTADADSAH